MRTSNHSSRFIEELYTRYPKQKLGEHISVVRGVSYKPSDVRSHNSETSTAIILRSNNISDGEINFDDLVFVVKERVQKDQELHTGDIVMCGSNGSISLVGKAGLLKTNRPNISFGAFCLGIKCKETVLPEYLNTYFNTPVYRKEIESMGNGTNIINIRPNNITNLMIPIPPSDKQKAFVDFVQQADKSKFTDFKSRFIEMFGNPVTNTKNWPTEPLSVVAPEAPSSDRQTGTVWILNLDMVESQTGKVINKVFDDSSKLNSVSAFDEGNVLFSKLRPYLNKVVVPDGKGYATTELVPLRPKENCLRKEFLAHLLRTEEFVSFADSIATGTKMPRMPMTALRDFDCILPPISLQEGFISIAKQADKSKYMS